MEGGNENTSNFFSILYDKHEGIVYGSDFEKFSFRSNIDHKINNKLKLGTRITGTYTVSNDVAMQDLYYGNPLFSAIMIQPFRTVRMMMEPIIWICLKTEIPILLPTAKYDKQWEKQYRLNGNVYLEWNILNDLTGKTTNSIEYTDGEGNRYWDPRANFGTDLGPCSHQGPNTFSSQPPIPLAIISYLTLIQFQLLQDRRLHNINIMSIGFTHPILILIFHFQIQQHLKMMMSIIQRRLILCCRFSE